MWCDIRIYGPKCTSSSFFPGSLFARLHTHVAHVSMRLFVCESVCLRASVYVFCRLAALYIVIICAHLVWQNVPCWIKFCCICTIFHRLAIGFSCMYVYIGELPMHWQLQQKPKLDHSLASSFVHFIWTFLFPQSPCVCLCVIHSVWMLVPIAIYWFENSIQCVRVCLHLIFSFSHARFGLEHQCCKWMTFGQKHT